MSDRPRSRLPGDDVDRRLLLAILGALIVVVVANNSAGSLAQPAIAEAFDAGPADVGWVVFGYSVAFAIATALWGGIARRLGLGPSLAIGIVLFAGASVAAALAPSLPALIAARLVQGAGSGAIPTLSAALIARRFPAGRERSRALGVTIASVATGLAIGPLIGGTALELVGWQGAVAFGALALPAALLLGRLDAERTPGRMDWIGAGLVAMTAFAGIYVANRLPLLGPTPATIAALAVLIGVGGLLVRRSLGSEAAFLPRRVVTAPPFLRAVILGAIGMAAFLGSLVLVPVAAATAHGLSGVALGLLLLPLAAAAAIASLTNHRVQGRLGRGRTSAVSLGMLGTGTLAIGLLGAEGPPPLMAIALIPVGAGFGLLNPPLLDALTSAFAEADQPVAVGTYNLGFFLGGSLGASLSTALVQTGIALPPLADRVLPGFTTAELGLACLALAATALVIRATRTSSASAGSGGPR